MNITKGRLREIIKEEVDLYVGESKKKETYSRIIESLRGELSKIFDTVQEAVNRGGDISEIKSYLAKNGMSVRNVAANKNSIVVNTKSGDFSIEKVKTKLADTETSITAKNGWSFTINPI